MENEMKNRPVWNYSNLATLQFSSFDSLASLRPSYCSQCMRASLRACVARAKPTPHHTKQSKTHLVSASAHPQSACAKLRNKKHARDSIRPHMFRFRFFFVGGKPHVPRTYTQPNNPRETRVTTLAHQINTCQCTSPEPDQTNISFFLPSHTCNKERKKKRGQSY